MAPWSDMAPIIDQAINTEAYKIISFSMISWK